MKKIFILFLVIISVTACGNGFLEYTISGTGDGWEVEDIKMKIYRDGTVEFVEGEFIITEAFNSIELAIYQFDGTETINIDVGSISNVDGAEISKVFKGKSRSVDGLIFGGKIYAAVTYNDKNQNNLINSFAVEVSEN